MHVKVSQAARKYQPVGGRDASLDVHTDRKSSLVASPPFGSIEIPPGVVLSFIRADGTIVRAANAR
jgi:hypothetical protein